MSLPLLYHFSYLFKLQITSLLRLNVFEQFSGNKKILTGFAAFLHKFFISESTPQLQYSFTSGVTFFERKCG